jgi:hypothetical protein
MVLQRAFSVIPAEAGIQLLERAAKYLDSGFHPSEDLPGKYPV